MSLKIELLIALWVIVALISIWVGTFALKNGDAAWTLAAEALERRGKTAHRSTHWDRSRKFNGGLSICVGVLLLGLAGYVGARQFARPATTPVSYYDAAAGQYVDRPLTPAEQAQQDKDPNALYQKLAHTGGKPASRP